MNGLISKLCLAALALWLCVLVDAAVTGDTGLALAGGAMVLVSGSAAFWCDWAGRKAP